MRGEAESHGPIRYLINTEHHVDHIFGNYWFKGAGDGRPPPGAVRRLHGPRSRSSTRSTTRSRRIPTDDPEGAALPRPGRLLRGPARRHVVFTGDLTLKVGDHTFDLLHTPGHTPGQLAVTSPRSASCSPATRSSPSCQTWLMTSNVDQWIEALERIRALDVDHVVPGHGPVEPKLDYVDAQRAVLLDGRPRSPTPWRRAGPARRRSSGSSFADTLPGRHRAGVHDGPHPDRNAGVALGQAHRPRTTRRAATRRRIRPRRHPPGARIVVGRSCRVAARQVPVGPRAQGNQGDEQADRAGDDEDECHAAVRTRAEPWPDQVGQRPVGHRRDDPELRDRADEERRDRRRRPVSRLWAKPNTRPCSVNGTTFWMIVCSDASATGISEHVDEEADRERQDSRTGREEDRHDHMTTFTSSSVRTGLRAEPAPSDQDRRRR